MDNLPRTIDILFCRCINVGTHLYPQCPKTNQNNHKKNKKKKLELEITINRRRMGVWQDQKYERVNIHGTHNI